MTPTNTATLDHIMAAAATAAAPLARMSPAERAALLLALAEGLDAHSEALIRTADAETHLGPDRLRGELRRTSFQLRLFAAEVAAGTVFVATVDDADPTWPMGPRPDLRRTTVPVGPVLVFAASNFPFAFGVAGGDTASALAAGCPVIVKAHSYQPSLSRHLADVVADALVGVDAPVGTFAMITGREAGTAALVDPRIAAAGFTGSLGGGRALFDLAMSRDVPIPFYGELSSLNPIFVTAAAAAARADDIAEGFVASFTQGAGQFCTKPGVLFVPMNSGIEERIRRRAADGPRAQLLHPTLAAQFHLHRSQVAAAAGEAIDDTVDDRPAAGVIAVDLEEFVARPDDLLVECFGPSALVVRYGDSADLLDAARQFRGELTAGIHGEDSDSHEVAPLVRVLAERAGRILWNNWPTGVTVSWAQQHGGPYPATSAPLTTSVGVGAIARFLRPVAFQGLPQNLLPAELRDANPWNVPQRRNGAPVVAPRP